MNMAGTLIFGRVLLLVCFATLGRLSSAVSPAAANGHNKIDIQYTIENKDFPDDFQFTLQMKTEQRSFFSIMDEAVDEDRHFLFAFKEHPEFGAFITMLNGLQSEENKTYWQLVKRDSEGDHMTAVGATSLIPDDGDHIVWKFTPLGQANVPGQITVQYTIENLDAPDVFQYTVTLSTTQKSFLYIMDEAVDEDRHFWFAWTEHPVYGAFITMINGLEWEKDKYYWQLVKRDSDGDHPASVGASSLKPLDGDHIVWKFTPYTPYTPHP